MRVPILALLLLAASSLAASEGGLAKPFPDDYQPQPCAVANSGTSFDRATFVAQAARMRGITSLTSAWLTAYWDEMHEALAPIADKSAACFTSPGATFTFCNDAVVPEMKATCDRFPAGSSDRNQCTAFVDAFASGRDQRSLQWWKQSQECARAAGTLTVRQQTPIVWTEPATIPPNYDGLITFYAVDPQTRLPVQALVTVEGQKIYTSSAPIGMPTTYYPFKWPVKLKRVENSDGHRDVIAPTVTVSSEWYPRVTLPMPVTITRMSASMTPPADQLRRGTNVVTVTTVDAECGKPVEARVMMGDVVIGESNRPVTIEIPKNGRRADIWVTSLFNTHSDVVVAPARK
ncbi:MAG: hypothetical protein WA208_14850 [Thermoanaerobaculia bacterium]